MASTDSNGQPKWSFRGSQNIDRSIDELIGLAKGLIADGQLLPCEVDVLTQWMEANKHVAGTWPASVIYDRIQKITLDGVVTPQERQDLFELLKELTGPSLSENATTELPLDKPQPKIAYPGRSFCLTGKFAFGPRSRVAEEIITRGGFVVDKVNKTLCYLVIGTLGSRDWMHTSHGRKIEAAIGLREAYDPEDGYQRVAIINEQHWAESLDVSPILVNISVG
jgi:hypothetical protein